jgi:predicted ribosome quality control (RQC) complex YloA/Tae2 family protein
VELDAQTLQIALDPKLSPVEQAERMFDRAAKLERAAEFIPQRRNHLEADLVFLAQLGTDLALAQNQPEIAAVREELRSAGFLRQRHGRPTRLGRDVSQPLRFLSPEGFRILVGRNARQNEIVTFQEAKADDLWLHVRDVPGAHVVVRCGGQPVGAETRQAAAQLAAYFSSRRGDHAVPVAVTHCRFVTRMAGGRPGQVHYRNEETLTVPAEMPDL